MFASRLRSNFGKKQLFSVPPTQTHEIISEKKNPFCNFSFFHCPHLLLCDGRSVIMRSGFFTRKTSVSSLYFLMYFPPLSLKRPMVFIESGRGAWKKKKKKQICAGEITVGEVVECCICIFKRHIPKHWKTANFLLSQKAADRWKKTSTYYLKKKKILTPYL